jgi:hypothetical protein
VATTLVTTDQCALFSIASMFGVIYLLPTIFKTHCAAPETSVTAFFPVTSPARPPHRPCDQSLKRLTNYSTLTSTNHRRSVVVLLPCLVAPSSPLQLNGRRRGTEPVHGRSQAQGQMTPARTGNRARVRARLATTRGAIRVRPKYFEEHRHLQA